MDTTTAGMAIETLNLTKRYPRGFRKGVTKALSDLCLEVRRGEIFGFLGPNGAGKTTMIKLLMGFISPTSGEGRILGRPIGAVAAHRRIGYLPENPCFHDFLNGRQALHFYGSLCGLDRRRVLRETDRLREALGLSEELTTPLGKHSKGMLQRIGLAQALINDPELLVLDEPMSGLDPIGRKELRELILSLREQGKTIFFSSHILVDVELLCDRIAILVRGQLARTIDVARFLRGDRRFVVEFTGPDALRAAFPDASPTHDPDGGASLKLDSPEARDRAIPDILGKGGRILAVTEKAESLEDIFVRAVREHEGGNPA